MKKRRHKRTFADVLATRYEELEYWYLAMMEHPDSDIAHEEFCRAMGEIWELSKKVAPVKLQTTT